MECRFGGRIKPSQGGTTRLPGRTGPEILNSFQQLPQSAQQSLLDASAASFLQHENTIRQAE